MAILMQIGQSVLGGYEVEDLICQGGQACLAKGRDRQSGEFVAIKQLTASPEQPHYPVELARFQRAGRLRINHPAVVDPIDCDEEDGKWYLVMPFIEGDDLELHVRCQGGRLEAAQAVPIIHQMADGLAAIHAKGVVHRDFKPANVMVQPDGQARIIDLGICKVVQEATLTQGNGLLGSIYWMSPEQIADASGVDQRSDLYSLGAVFYFTLTGRPPVEANEPEAVALSICQTIPQPLQTLNSSIPLHIDAACMRLLAKRPEDRFQSAEAFCQALNSSIGSIGHSAFCASCGTQSEAADQYCRRCGACLCPSSGQQTRCLACGSPVDDRSSCNGCGQAFSPENHRLEFTSGPLSGTRFRIPEGIYAVGRAQLAPRDYHISRKQFLVACSNGMVCIQDGGSTNKTYVAGCPAQGMTVLSPKQELTIAFNRAIYTTSN